MSDLAYLQRLRAAICETYGIDSRHRLTSLVEGCFGKAVWEVEIFDLIDYPDADLCYAWASLLAGEELPTLVLKKPPVFSPATAVAAAVQGLNRKRMSHAEMKRRGPSPLGKGRVIGLPPVPPP